MATTEKPKPSGHRIFTKHTKMLSRLAKKRRVGEAGALRIAIENDYASVFNK